MASQLLRHLRRVWQLVLGEPPQHADLLAAVPRASPSSAEMNRAQSIFNRVFGVKPGPDAPKLDRLLWFRTYYLRNLGPMALGIAGVMLFLPPWIAAVVVLPWLVGFARLSAEIRREREQH